MIEAAVESLGEGSGGTGGILVVTVLTSLDERDLGVIGIRRHVPDQVAEMTRLAAASGAEGVVTSPVEIGSARQVDAGLTVVTPGVRPAGSPVNDQKRVATPAEALAAGADWLVIGRPITRATDPESAAAEIAASLA